MTILNKMMRVLALGCFFGAVIGITQTTIAKDNVRYPNVVLPGATIQSVTVRADIYIGLGAMARPRR